MGGRASGLGRLVVVLAVVVAAACVLASPDYDGDDASAAASSGASAGTGSGASAGTSANATSESDAGSGSAGASETGTSDASTTGPDVTTTGTTTTGTTSSSTSDGSTTEEEPPAMRLQHYADGACQFPLWCYFDPDIFDGQPARMLSQECFTGLTPPLRISRVGYWVAATRGAPTNPAIEVHGYEGGVPSPEPIAPPFALADADVTPGYHEVDVDYELMVESFCVGVGGGDLFADTGLGVAVDNVPPPAGRSFYRVDGAGQCNTNAAFYDIAAAKPTPTAQWCVDVDVQQL